MTHELAITRRPLSGRIRYIADQIERAASDSNLGPWDANALYLLREIADELDTLSGALGTDQHA